MIAIAHLVAIARKEMGDVVSRKVHVATAMVVAGLGGLGVLAMALVSLHRFVSREAGPFYADAVIGAIFLIVAVAGLAYAKYEQSKSRSSKDIRERISAALPVATQMASARPKLALASILIATVAGIAAGRKLPEKRG